MLLAQRICLIIAAAAALSANCENYDPYWSEDEADGGGLEENLFVHHEDWDEEIAEVVADDMAAATTRELGKHKKNAGGGYNFQAVPVFYPVYAAPAAPQVIQLPPTVVTLVRDAAGSRPCCY